MSSKERINKMDFLTNKKIISILGASISILLLLLGSLGWLDITEQEFRSIMIAKPLPKLYFLSFIGFGLIVPFSIKYLEKNKSLADKVIDPYLLLLGWQILAELILVKIVGKGLGVLVGFIFSSIRIFQLMQLLSILKTDKLIKKIILMLLFLWSLNVFQIVINRIVPFVSSIIAGNV